MSFELTPSVPPNIPEDKVYSIGDFNNYFEQLQRVISRHDDNIISLVSDTAKCLPFFLNPETIDTNLTNGVYYITSTVAGTFPTGVTGSNSFLFSVINGSTSIQFLFDFSGIYSRQGYTSNWRNLSGASVIDELTSTSTIDSLSANQGRVLDEKKVDHFTHNSEDYVDIDENLEYGVHVCINSQVSGTFPNFMSILPGANKFIIKSYGVANELISQVITDGSIMGMRTGYLDRDFEGTKFWAWTDWEQLATTSFVTEQAEMSVESMRPLELYCTKGEQVITLKPGTYNVKCWGAQGGGYVGSNIEGGNQGGAGGYVEANLSVIEEQELYAYVGEHPTSYLGGFPFAGSSLSDGGPLKGKGFGGGGCTFISVYNLPNVSDSLVPGEEFAAKVKGFKIFNVGVTIGTTATVGFKIPGANHWNPTDNPYWGGACIKFYITVNGENLREILHSDLDPEKESKSSESGTAWVKITLTDLTEGSIVGIRADIIDGHGSTYTSPLLGNLIGPLLVITVTDWIGFRSPGSDLFSVGLPLLCAGGGGGASSFSPGAVSGQLLLTSGDGAGKDSTNAQFGAGGSGRYGGIAATAITEPGGGGANFVGSSTDNINIEVIDMYDGVRYGDGLIRITRIR